MLDKDILPHMTSVRSQLCLAANVVLKHTSQSHTRRPPRHADLLAPKIKWVLCPQLWEQFWASARVAAQSIKHGILTKFDKTRLYFRVQSVWTRIQSHHWPWTHQCTGHWWWRWWFLGPGHKSLKNFKTEIRCVVLCILPPYFRHGTHQRRQIRSWSSGFPAMAAMAAMEGLCQTTSKHAALIGPCRSFRRTATGPGRHWPATHRTPAASRASSYIQWPYGGFHKWKWIKMVGL